MIKVISAEPQQNYSLYIRLSNGREGSFNVTQYLDKGIFTELKNLSYFNQVRVAFGGVVWPNNKDFSADTIEFELIGK